MSIKKIALLFLFFDEYSIINIDSFILNYFNMKNKKYLFVVLLLIVITLFQTNNIVSAIKDCPTGQVCLNNPLKTDSPQALIGKIINAALGIVGSLALVMFIYGGFMWMMAGGNAERVQKGKDTLVWAALGLVIIFSSYALVRFVLKAIGAE
ncbi:pilin [Patescibacteria group bacterium]|nr:pilin [Patescibacteria group bacterium]